MALALALALASTLLFSVHERRHAMLPGKGARRGPVAFSTAGRELALMCPVPFFLALVSPHIFPPPTE
jgi:hypothetical protein